ncbi:MAG TPA: 3TM-type holin [Candidatus Paceibacterota bacterium]|nr:3TM-type holin [Candidatus Paceibacterota bacterium]
MLGIGSVLEFGTTLINKIFPDKEAANAAKLKLLELQQTGELKELEAQAQIVNTEAASKHWLAANWRPITMLVFVGLIVARWFGWAAPNLSEAEYLKLWTIVELGLGGYVIGRSAEKLIPKVAEALKK